MYYLFDNQRSEIDVYVEYLDNPEIVIRQATINILREINNDKIFTLGMPISYYYRIISQFHLQDDIFTSIWYNVNNNSRPNSHIPSNHI